MFRIKFDGPDQPQIISVEPDDNVEFTEWIQDGNGWVLEIHFFRQDDRFGWSGDQVRFVKKSKAKKKK